MALEVHVCFHCLFSCPTQEQHMFYYVHRDPSWQIVAFIDWKCYSRWDFG